VSPSERRHQTPAADDAGAADNGRLRMPEEVRALSHGWRSLVDEIPDLTTELEKDFRFGHSVVDFPGGYRLGGSIKGGSSTIWTPVTAHQYAAYQGWVEREGIPQEEDRPAYDALRRLLERHEIAFRNVGSSEAPDGEHYVPSRGYIYRALLGILKRLPRDHLIRPQFTRLQIGGWGPDSAKASAYADGAILLYDFAIRGARRTFLGLALHELGHAHEASLTQRQLNTLSLAHEVIAQAGALIGLEFLLDGESRKVYQQFLLSEFIAETYVVYVSQGERLRRYTSGQESPTVRGAWQSVYETFRKTFGGVEYE
jgi:hypothetical protein